MGMVGLICFMHSFKRVPHTLQASCNVSSHLLPNIGSIQQKDRGIFIVMQAQDLKKKAVGLVTEIDFDWQVGY